MNRLPQASINSSQEFLDQCDQDKLAKARAGDETAKKELNDEFKVYEQTKAGEVEFARNLKGAANLAEFRADPAAVITALHAEAGTFYVHELAEMYGLFKIVKEGWSREAGSQHAKGTDWGGKVATKGWKAVIEISDRRYEITGSSFYDAPRRHESVAQEAWRTLLKTVGK